MKCYAVEATRIYPARDERLRCKANVIPETCGHAAFRQFSKTPGGLQSHGQPRHFLGNFCILAPERAEIFLA